jgi:hypothetical protein
MRPDASPAINVASGSENASALIPESATNATLLCHRPFRIHQMRMVQSSERFCRNCGWPTTWIDTRELGSILSFQYRLPVRERPFVLDAWVCRRDTKDYFSELKIL